MAGEDTATVSKQRIGWIDAAKGLTIILVVMEHTTFGVQNAVGHLPLIFGTITEFAKPFRMPLFFLVAGLVVAGGQRMEELIPKYVERIGWSVVILAVAIGGYLMSAG